jgi:hypothetical protein
MQQRHGFAPLGSADGEVKRKIFGLNAAHLFGVDPQAREWLNDELARTKTAYAEAGGERSNRLFGMIRRPEGV